MAAALSPLTIGGVAKAVGVNVQTLRYYERVGLLPKPKRSTSGYRIYSDATVRTVMFVKRAQELGFTLREVKELLRFRTAGLQSRDAVRAAAQAKVADLDARIADLAAIRSALSSLLERCSCECTKPECPILEALERGEAGAVTSRRHVTPKDRTS